jgi:hypothetical protein
MFFLKTKKQIIEVLPNAALSMTYANPAFDAQDRAFSLPFVTLNDIVENTEGELYLDGLPLQKGVIVPLRAQKRVIECAFKSMPTQVRTILETLKINEILPTIDLLSQISTSTFEGVIIEPNAGQLGYSLKIKGKTYSKTYTSPPASDIVCIDFRDMINADLPLFSALMPTGGVYRLQFHNLSYESYQIEWSTVSNFTVIQETYPADFLEISFRNLLSVSQPDFVLPIIGNGSLYEGGNKTWLNFANNNQNGTITANTWHAEKYCQHTFCPQVRFAYILRKAFDIVATKLNATITLNTDAPHNQTVSECTLFNLVTIDNFLQEFLSTDSPVVPKYKNAYTRTIALNNHVPDMTVGELIDAFCEIFQLYPVFEDNNFGFKSSIDQMATTPIDLTEHSNYQIEKEYKTAEGFTLAFAKDDEETAVYPAPLVVGGVKTITTKAGTVAWGEGTVKYLLSEKKGTSTPLSIQSKTPLRFYFYKGFKTHNAITYPFGTPLNQLPNGTIDGVTSLVWEGAEGLYQKAWRGIAEAANDAPTVKITAWLSALEIIKMRIWSMPLVRIYSENGYRKGIVKQISFRARLAPQTRYECDLEIFEI